MKTHIRYSTREERLEAWRANRASYNQWRKTPEAYKWIAWVRKKQQNLCFICVLPLGEQIHVDHIFPLYLGGTSEKINLCVTHPKCNMDKGTRVTLTYRQACHRRRQFNRMRKAQRAKAHLKKNPNARLSKKSIKAIRLVDELSTT